MFLFLATQFDLVVLVGTDHLELPMQNLVVWSKLAKWLKN